jgi:cyclopropane fatty-acyl-phospholipid synthase-like methyltransferase
MPDTVKLIHPEKWFQSDQQFDQLYPLPIQKFSSKHWTPLEIARQAAGFLAIEKNVRILDIGSGIGKFCLSAAHHRPNAFYYGIEQRQNLIHHADSVKKILGSDNVFFIHGNFTQIDLRDYDHFYFYNSFYENVSAVDKIDDSIDYSVELYNYYNRYLYKQLEQMPAGTRLATFHSLEEEIPKNYHSVNSDKNNLLEFWTKT